MTVKEYVDVTEGVAVGFCALVDNKLFPDHIKTLVFAPGVAVSVTVVATHIGPLFTGAADGLAFTLTVLTALQDPIIYEMVVVPTLAPVNVPSVPIVATVVNELLHVPPPIPSVNCVIPPVQTVVMPLIADGVVFTVTVAVKVPVPQVFVTI